jgi:VWFA-related protein
MLLDTLNGDFAEQAFIKDELAKYLATAKIERPIAVFALEERLRMLHDFTTDNMALKKAVDRFKPPARPNNAESVQSRSSAFTNYGNYHTSELNIDTTLRQLNVLAKTLAGYPGRKNVIWLSESFPISLYPEVMMSPRQNPHPGGAYQKGRMTNGDLNNPNGGLRGPTEGTGSGAYRDYAELIKKVSDALMNAQVAVYVVNASAVSKDERLAAQHTANEVAERTGGVAFHNTSDLAASMRSSVDDGSTYYTISYYPENRKWDGQFRAIQVKTSRPDVKLRYRVGYYALDPEKLSQEENARVSEDFSRSLQVDAPGATAVHFQAGVVPPSDRTGKKLVVNFGVDPRTIRFERSHDGLEHARISCTVWAYAKDKDKPIMSSGETRQADLKPEVYDALMKQYFPCKQELDLKPGTYTLRLGVLDRTSNLMGTTSATVTVQ